MWLGNALGRRGGTRFTTAATKATWRINQDVLVWLGRQATHTCGRLGNRRWGERCCVARCPSWPLLMRFNLIEAVVIAVGHVVTSHRFCFLVCVVGDPETISLEEGQVYCFFSLLCHKHFFSAPHFTSTTSLAPTIQSPLERSWQRLQVRQQPIDARQLRPATGGTRHSLAHVSPPSFF